MSQLRNDNIKVIMVTFAFMFAILRLYGINNDIYKDFAHIFVGICIGAWLADIRLKLYGYMAVFLSILELLAALYFGVMR